MIGCVIRAQIVNMQCGMSSPTVVSWIGVSSVDSDLRSVDSDLMASCLIFVCPRSGDSMSCQSTKVKQTVAVS